MVGGGIGAVRPALVISARNASLTAYPVTLIQRYDLTTINAFLNWIRAWIQERYNDNLWSYDK